MRPSVSGQFLFTLGASAFMVAFIAGWAGICVRDHHTIYGVAWFAGSVIIGALYAVDVLYAAGFMFLMQCVAVPVLLSIVREQSRNRAAIGPA